MGRHSAPAAEAGKSRAPLIGAGVIVGLAVVAGGAFLATRGDDAAPTASNASSTVVTSAVATSSVSASAANASSAASASSATSVAGSSAAPSSTAAAATSTASSAAAGTPTDTLLLLDTSEGMGPYFGPASAALADAARGIGGSGHAVALWNYSSPLSPGVSVGYRDNLGFGSADEAASAVGRFGTGGVPQTRSALVAAAQVAADRAQETNKPARVLLVTSGTQSDMDDAAFAAALGGVKNVDIAVVHVGSAPVDAVVKEKATSFETVANGNDAAALSAAIKKVAG